MEKRTLHLTKKKSKRQLFIIYNVNTVTTKLSIKLNEMVVECNQDWKYPI